MTADKSVVFRATVVDGRLVLTSDAPLSVKELLGCTLDAGELADEVVLHPRDRVYSQRQQLMALACAMGLRLGLRAGRYRDPEADERRFDEVLHLDLPTGQVTIHVDCDDEEDAWLKLPEIQRTWDGHTQDQAFAAVREFVRCHALCSPASVHTAGCPFADLPGPCLCSGSAVSKEVESLQQRLADIGVELSQLNRRWMEVVAETTAQLAAESTAFRHRLDVLRALQQVTLPVLRRRTT